MTEQRKILNTMELVHQMTKKSGEGKTGFSDPLEGSEINDKLLRRLQALNRIDLYDKV